MLPPFDGLPFRIFGNASHARVERRVSFDLCLGENLYVFLKHRLNYASFQRKLESRRVRERTQNEAMDSSFRWNDGARKVLG